MTIAPWPQSFDNKSHKISHTTIRKNLYFIVLNQNEFRLHTFWLLWWWRRRWNRSMVRFSMAEKKNRLFCTEKWCFLSRLVWFLPIFNFRYKWYGNYIFKHLIDRMVINAVILFKWVQLKQYMHPFSNKTIVLSYRHKEQWIRKKERTFKITL